MTSLTADADLLLGVGLPLDDPAAAARAADQLREAAGRLAVLARGTAGLLPVARWSGVAAVAADRRLLDSALALTAERDRLTSAATALTAFSRAVGTARSLADEAAQLLAGARSVQAGADRRDPALAATRSAGSWSGPRADGALYDPAAVALLDRARARARESRETYDRAAARLTSALTGLSGRRVVRAGLSPRVLLDVAGLVPVAGDAIDAVTALDYLRRRRWADAALYGATAVPGPEGWIAGGSKIARAVRRVGDVEHVVDDLPAAEAVALHVGALLVRGRRSTVRLLPDDEAVAAFYWERLERLGTTTPLDTPRGTGLVTHLPGGGRVVFRRFSESGGFTIDIDQVPTTPVRTIHRAGGRSDG